MSTRYHDNQRQKISLYEPDSERTVVVSYTVPGMWAEYDLPSLREAITAELNRDQENARQFAIDYPYDVQRIIVNTIRDWATYLGGFDTNAITAETVNVGRQEGE